MKLKAHKEIKDTCRKFQVSCLILFGSRAKGEAEEASDFDIGVLFKKDISADQELKFFYDLVNLLKTDAVDIVTLNRAHPVLQKEAVLYGIPLYEEREGIFDEYLIQAIDKYQDTKEIRKIEEELLKEYLEERKKYVSL